MAAIGTVRFASADIAVTALLGEGIPIQTQGFGGWEEIALQRRKSITSWKGRQPWRITIPIQFDKFDRGAQGESVEPEVRALEKLAGGGIQGQPPVVQFDSGGLIPHDFHDAPQVLWVIDGIEFADAIRNSYGNRVRCDMTVTVLEYVAGALLREASAAARSQERKSTSAAGAAKKRYTVKSGDTLSKIAQSQLKDSKRWREIAELNGLRDPRNIKAGQVLRLP